MTLYTEQIAGTSRATEVYLGLTELDNLVYEMSGEGADAYRALDPASDARKRLLIDATRYIDRQRWQGTRNAAGGTMLAFPRDDLEDEDGEAASNEYQLTRVGEAVARLVAIAALDPDVLTAADQSQNIKSMGAGSAKLEFFGSTSRRAGTATKLPTAVHELIGQWLAGSGGAVGLSVAGVSTGTESDSFFDECDKNERSEAF